MDKNPINMTDEKKMTDKSQFSGETGNEIAAHEVMTKIRYVF